MCTHRSVLKTQLSSALGPHPHWSPPVTRLVLLLGWSSGHSTWVGSSCRSSQDTGSHRTAPVPTARGKSDSILSSHAPPHKHWRLQYPYFPTQPAVRQLNENTALTSTS